MADTTHILQKLSKQALPAYSKKQEKSTTTQNSAGSGSPLISSPLNNGLMVEVHKTGEQYVLQGFVYAWVL